jgi:hypothetical protein
VMEGADEARRAFGCDACCASAFACFCVCIGVCDCACACVCRVCDGGRSDGGIMENDAC